MLKITIILAAFIGSSANDIPNAEYESWKKFKPGTSVTMTMTTHLPDGHKTEAVIVTTLGQVDAKKLVLKSKTVITVAGEKIESTMPDRDVPARMKPIKVDDETEPPLDVKTENGKGSLEIAGRKLTCEWTKVTSKINGQEVVSKTWYSADAPGGFVKSETQGPGNMRSTMEITKLIIK